MNNNDIHNIANLYEEGFWDRFKAGTSAIGGGVKNMKMFGGSGYAQGAQQAKSGSLMKSFVSKMLKDIEKFDSDISSYKQNNNSNDIINKVNSIKQVLYKHQNAK